MSYSVAREVSTGHVCPLSEHPSRAAAELAAIRYRKDRPNVSYVVLGGNVAEWELNGITTLDRYLASRSNSGNASAQSGNERLSLP